MGYNLKLGKTYISPNSTEYATGYARVARIINQKDITQGSLVFRIYENKDKADANPDKNKLEQGLVDLRDYIDAKGVKHLDYTDYLSPANVAADKDEYFQGYKYIEDNQLDIGGFDFADWESDE